MGVVFTSGSELKRGDLDIFLTNSSGGVTNAFSITYSVAYVDPISHAEVIVGSSSRTPVNPAVGEYYASLLIPAAAVAGDYRIRWTFREQSAYPNQQVVQEFGVVQPGTIVNIADTISGCRRDLVKKLRIMIRDNSPDRNYHFRPPQGEGDVGCNTTVFGQIWEDEELLEYLEIALWRWNSMPPETEVLCNVDALCQKKPVWRAAILWGAVQLAAQALAFNWTADSFSVSPDTIVRVVLPSGQDVCLPIHELFQRVRSNILPDSDIHDAFHAGMLQVQAVSPDTGEVSLYPITDVLQHDTEHKSMVRTTLVDGRFVDTTVDHSLFHRKDAGIVSVAAGEIRKGDIVAVVSVSPVGAFVLDWVEVCSVEEIPCEKHTYDLCVPGPQNFVIANGILAHNSYSIGGISLDINKTSDYMSLKDSAEQQFTALAEAKARTTKFMLGLSMPRFSPGIRSSFGPFTGRGQVSPRNFF